MGRIHLFLLTAALGAAGLATAQASQRPPSARVVELKAPDGVILKGSYFAAGRPGPGVLLLHQSNRTRRSWDGVAARLAAAGINTLTLDLRGFGDSGGAPYGKMADAAKNDVWLNESADIDTAFDFLAAQPGVARDVIGVGGAGVQGVNQAVNEARHRPAQVKSLALLSGETFEAGLRFLREAAQLPGLYVAADDDEYPPTEAAMELLYVTAANPGKKLVHYVGPKAPWLWLEPYDIGKVPAKGGHGTDLFKPHPELPGIIVDWFVTTLIMTPGHAPPDAVAAAPLLAQLEMPGGVAQVTQFLIDARASDPKVQLWPETGVDIVAADHERAGEIKKAIEIYQLNLLAYPDSADAHDSLADAYLKDGQKDLARHHAEKGLALLDSHAAPASSWSDTEQRRGLIRKGLERTLERLQETQQ